VRALYDLPNEFRQDHPLYGAPDIAQDGRNGFFEIPHPPTNVVLRVVASDGEGWEHVSVSLRNRCPNWPEMCHVKRLFWGDDEAVIQYHPRESQYVNCHPFCLHLWRPTRHKIPEPPMSFVGPMRAPA